MKNSDLIRLYVSGGAKERINGHLGFRDDYLVNYMTVICYIRRSEKVAVINSRKYSSTTNRIVGTLKSILHEAGYTIEYFEGTDATLWNCGYQGASNMNRDDIEIAIRKAEVRLGAM